MKLLMHFRHAIIETNVSKMTRNRVDPNFHFITTVGRRRNNSFKATCKRAVLKNSTILKSTTTVECLKLFYKRLFQ